jgi:DDE_Tnp_1-associated
MVTQVNVSLLDHFAALPDPRQHAKVLYPLPEILLLVLASTIAGADDFVETTLWGAEHLAFLRRFYRYESGIPSHDTLCDVFAALDPELFKACFLAWINDLRDEDPRIPTSSPLMGRPHGAATINGRAATPCISSRPGRRGNGSCSDSRQPRRNPMRSLPSRCCCNISI